MVEEKEKTRSFCRCTTVDCKRKPQKKGLTWPLAHCWPSLWWPIKLQSWYNHYRLPDFYNVWYLFVWFKRTAICNAVWPLCQIECFKNQLINLASVSSVDRRRMAAWADHLHHFRRVFFFPPLRKKIDCNSSELTLNVELLLGDCTLSDTASGRDAIWNRDGRGCWLYSSKFSLGGLKPREMCFGQHTIRCYTFPFGFATASGFVSLNLSTPVAPSLSPLQKISFLPFLICHVYEPFPTPVGSCG